MPSTKTKALIAVGLLDLARQATRGWAAQQQSRREESTYGWSRTALARAHDYRPSLGIPPWHRKETFGTRMLHALPLAAIVFAASAAVAATARWVARHEPAAGIDDARRDSKLIGAVRAGSVAIDAGVTKVAEGGHGAAVGTASVVAAGTSAAQTAVVDKAKQQLDERVVQPVKQKAILYGSIAMLALTLYIMAIAATVQLVVVWLG